MRLYVERQAEMRYPIGVGTHKEVRSLDEPAPAILTHGRLHTTSEVSIVYSDTPPPMTVQQTTDKPPYRVPSMAEIASLPWNGYSAISTFSGCGGSSLGYKMAGFRVLWANEFIPAAQETYRANHPSTILDTRDIRIVQPEEILDAIGMGVGELDLFDGSPPCASFSTAGKREAGWGKVKQYSDTKQRTDDLFFEYVRLLQGVQPKVFVAENVSGLVKGTAKGYFKEILAAFKACGYNVKAQLLDAQWLGVPQMRQRIIFIGVRNDLGIAPIFPTPLPYRYSVRDALPWIEQVSNLLPGKQPGMQEASLPCPTVTTGDTGGNGRHAVVARRAYLDKRGAFGNDGDITDQPAPTVLSDSIGTHWIEEETDISRYAIGREWDTLAPGESTYYGGRLWKPDTELPCPTVTQIGGNTGASSVTHPTEKRKFSIAELKRICAFPDDFILTGTYAQQWERLGRAVPPVMMSHIAATIRDKILCKIP
jgi:DNA (cytosine-5)-methyltransferase 1